MYEDKGSNTDGTVPTEITKILKENSKEISKLVHEIHKIEFVDVSTEADWQFQERSSTSSSYLLQVNPFSTVVAIAIGCVLASVI